MKYHCKDFIILIDDNYLSFVIQYNWSLNPDGYVYTRKNGNYISLHRHVLNVKTGDIVDHINGNLLDNRKQNLRVCNHGENNRNRKLKGKNNTSGYKGVGFHKVSQKWRARITFNGEGIWLGLFDTKEEAALAYNEAAIKYHKEFARLNVILL
jgi:hypothetical protein